MTFALTGDALEPFAVQECSSFKINRCLMIDLSSMGDRPNCKRERLSICWICLKTTLHAYWHGMQRSSQNEHEVSVLREQTSGAGLSVSKLTLPAEIGVTAYMQKPVHRARPNEQFLQATLRNIQTGQTLCKRCLMG